MADPFVLVPAPDPMIGRVIDRFVVMTPLARGGMGAVYLAQHEGSPHVRCVIKTMLAHVANNAMMIARFKIETEAVSRLKHDNIVKLENFGVLDDGQMFMRFEYIAGKPLDHYLTEHGGRLSLHRAAYLAFQVCDALDHAHAVGVVHRDLKPDNLLIVVDLAARVPQLVKVVDFGISKVLRVGEVQTGSGMSMGTPYFMAVEQYANAAEATERTDVFSLGVITWLMVTGELPWGRPDPTVLYHLQRTVIPPRPPEDVMPAAVATILLRCFSVEPQDRPTMRELAVALASAIPTTERAPSGSEILVDLVPRFVVSAPDYAQTVRHAVVRPDRVAAQLWPQLETDAARRDGGGGRWSPLSASTYSVAQPGQPREPAQAVAPEPAPRRPQPAGALQPGVPAQHRSPPQAQSPVSPVSPPTAHERPRAGHPGPGLTPAAQHFAAALPTGLTSAEFVAAQPLAHAPVPSIVAASEFVLPAGTPGPRPYAHRELPPVVLSTQISESSQSTARSSVILRRGKFVLVAAAVGLLAAVVGFALAHFGSRSNPSDNSSNVASADRRAGESVTRDGIAARTVAATVEDAGVAASGASPAMPASAGTGVDASAPSPTVQVDVTLRETHVTPKAVEQPSVRADAGTAAVPGPGPAEASRALPARPRIPAPAAPSTASAASSMAEGELVISVRPWAAVWLNGKSIPDGTPYRSHLPAGRYRVRLTNDDVGQSENVTVTVEPHKTTTIERKW